MGRTLYIENHLLTYLHSVAKPDRYNIGLILGQSTGQKDYILHLAKTPPPLIRNVVEEPLIRPLANIHDDTSVKYVNFARDIPESWVADHAKHVTRMLPGGMWVLGIFITGPQDILTDSSDVQKLRSILIAIYKNLASNIYLYGNNNEESLVLYYSSTTQKCIGKSMEPMKDGMLKAAVCKFQSKIIKWYQLEAFVDFDRLFAITADKDPVTLKKVLQDILKDISNMVDSSIVIIEGEAKSPDITMEMISKKKKSVKNLKHNDKESNIETFDVDLYLPCPKKLDTEIKVTSCNASLSLAGQLVSRIFMHEKADIEQAVTAIKQDIIRSLGSRLEMHCDSLIEEENGSPEENITLHEPPRRVLIALPYSGVTLSDYLFPGEGSQEALISLQELLDLEVHENSVQKDIELRADPTEFYCQNDADIVPLENGKDISRNQSTVYIIGISLAFIVLVAAVLIHQLY